MKFLYGLLFVSVMIISCDRKNPLRPEVIAEIPPKTLSKAFNFPVEEEVYIPIYSDIYSRTRNYKVLLAATLSIRNTSRTDSLFIKNVDYYDSAGHFVRHYIEEPIYLNPLETIDYVIDEEDEAGGSGANFLVTWGATKEITPIFQAVMLGSIGQQGITFTTDGVTVSKKTPRKLRAILKDSLNFQ